MGVSKLKFGGVLVNSVTTNSLTTHKVRINGNLVWDDSVSTHTVTFSCQHGTVIATVDGVEIQSGAQVEHGKSVVFTIYPSAHYHYHYTNPETVLVDADVTRNYVCDIDVFFVDFSCTNGSVGATVDGIGIQSGGFVDYGKTVVFTITPDDGYEYTGTNPESVVVHDNVEKNYECTPVVTWTGLKFTSVGYNTLQFIQQGNWVGTWPIEYSRDNGETWREYTLSTTFNLSDGATVCFRGQKDSTSQSEENYRKFYIGGTGTVNVSGDVTSLLNGVGGVTDLTPYGNYTFRSMFYGCTSLTSAPSLPATTLAEYCYSSMFRSCTSLTTAPSLPATTLAEYCYYAMFYGCTSLTSAPSLPATTLAEDCYQGMFYGCTSLTSAPSLPAATLAEYCYYRMFYGCTSLTSAPSLPATNLAPSCYDRMFDGCTSLTSAPSLPATTLANSCYSSMFYGCTSLTSAPSLPATTLAPYCYSSMFNGCTSLTTAPSLSATILAQGCYSSMFNGCTSLTTAPSLSATILAQGCYSSMFQNCSRLTSTPTLPATILAQGCYQGMFSNCTNLTSAPSLPATTLTQSCYYEMFYNCTSLTIVPSLPATTLAERCYYNMFRSCTSLTGPVNISATSPYYTETTSACVNMFTNSGTSRPSTPTDYNKIKVGGNVSLWDSTTAGINSTYWTVELITEGDIEEQ